MLHRPQRCDQCLLTELTGDMDLKAAIGDPNGFLRNGYSGDWFGLRLNLIWNAGRHCNLYE